MKAHSVDKSPNVLKFQTFRIYTIELLGQLSTHISNHRAVPAFVIKNRGTGGRSRSTCALLRVRPMKAVNSGSNRYQDIRSGERTYTQTTTTGQSRCWVDGIRLIYCLAMIGSRGGMAGGGNRCDGPPVLFVCLYTNTLYLVTYFGLEYNYHKFKRVIGNVIN